MSSQQGQSNEFTARIDRATSSQQGQTGMSSDKRVNSKDSAMSSQQGQTEQRVHS